MIIVDVRACVRVRARDRDAGIGLEPNDIDATPESGQRLQEGLVVRRRQDDAGARCGAVRQRREPAHGLRRQRVRRVDQQEKRRSSRDEGVGVVLEDTTRGVAGCVADSLENPARKRIRRERLAPDDQRAHVPLDAGGDLLEQGGDTGEVRALEQHEASGRDCATQGRARAIHRLGRGDLADVDPLAHLARPDWLPRR